MSAPENTGAGRPVYREGLRDAEPHEAHPCRCPVCRRPLSWRDEVYTIELGDAPAGCSQCLHAHSAEEWFY